MIVKNDKGIETSHKSLNDYFSKQKLVFEGPVNLDASNDYNADNLFDIPIGFPAGDGSGQYQYGIFSIDKDGKIFSLPVKGYKDDGFVYTALDDKHSAALTQIDNFADNRQHPAILMGIRKDGGYEPAKYVWDGKQFNFSSPFVVANAETNAHNQKYSITAIQTEYKKPLTPEDEGFSIFESMYRGRFDLLVQDSSGKVTSRISLNKYFGDDDLGFGDIPLKFKDYNQDGNADFVIGRPAPIGDSPDFQYALFSVNPEGIVYNLPAVGYRKDGYIYSAETRAGFPLLNNDEVGIVVTLGSLFEYRFAQAKYLWDGSRFVFQLN